MHVKDHVNKTLDDRCQALLKDLHSKKDAAMKPLLECRSLIEHNAELATVVMNEGTTAFVAAVCIVPQMHAILDDEIFCVVLEIVGSLMNDEKTVMCFCFLFLAAVCSIMLLCVLKLY